MKVNKAILGIELQILLLLGFFLSSKLSIAQGQLQFAALGDFPLQNGQVMKDCKIGYRTFGKLNAMKSNAILFPTYYGGTSASLIGYIGEDQMLDTIKYFVVIVDAFGDGVSSSPSNSVSQPGKLFPEFSIKDMVDAQYQMLTEKLGIKHLYAVTGISMGGMQTFQWMMSYPDFFDKAAPIVGSPLLSSQDLLLFDLFSKIMEQCQDADCPEITALALELEYLTGFTPAYRKENTSPNALPNFLKAIEKEASNYKLRDLLSQMKAIGKHNVTNECEDSLEIAAKRFKGAALITIANQDQTLSPLSSIALAKLMNAKLLELDTNCGHYAFACEKERISEAVRNFLN